MINPEEARKRATANFLSGLNCTQSVVEVFSEELGFDKKVIMSLALPFGGGTCRMRETCGTFNGMMLCLGMKLGVPDGDKNRKDRVYAIGQELASRFRMQNGSTICRELLGLVPMGTSEALFKAGKPDAHEAEIPVSEARTEAYYKKRPCAELCGTAAEIFAEWLIEFSKSEQGAGE